MRLHAGLRPPRPPGRCGQPRPAPRGSAHPGTGRHAAAPAPTWSPCIPASTSPTRGRRRGPSGAGRPCCTPVARRCTSKSALHRPGTEATPRGPVHVAVDWTRRVAPQNGIRVRAGCAGSTARSSGTSGPRGSGWTQVAAVEVAHRAADDLTAISALASVVGSRRTVASRHSGCRWSSAPACVGAPCSTDPHRSDLIRIWHAQRPEHGYLVRVLRPHGVPEPTSRQALVIADGGTAARRRPPRRPGPGGRAGRSAPRRDGGSRRRRRTVTSTDPGARQGHDADLRYRQVFDPVPDRLPAGATPSAPAVGGRADPVWARRAARWASDSGAARHDMSRTTLPR